LLGAGTDGKAGNEGSKTPWGYAQGNKKLKVAKEQ
tara:strand:- start:308 stop:412 length:105 start_codon:yes stop_codon:yes gene_type:complete